MHDLQITVIYKFKLTAIIRVIFWIYHFIWLENNQNNMSHPVIMNTVLYPHTSNFTHERKKNLSWCAGLNQLSAASCGWRTASIRMQAASYQTCPSLLQGDDDGDEEWSDALDSGGPPSQLQRQGQPTSRVTVHSAASERSAAVIVMPKHSSQVVSRSRDHQQNEFSQLSFCRSYDETESSIRADKCEDLILC